MNGLYQENVADIKAADGGVVVIPATKNDRASIDGQWMGKTSLAVGTTVESVRHFTGYEYAVGSEISLVDWNDESVRCVVTITEITLADGEWCLAVEC